MEANIATSQNVHPKCQVGRNPNQENTSPTTTELISYEECNQIGLPICYLALAVCFLAALFNIANLRVFHKIGFKNSINVCFFTLAAFDLLSCLSYVGIGFATLRHFGTINDTYTVIFLENSQYFFGSAYMMFAALSSWVTALISVERSLAITLPFKVTRLITKQTVVILIVVKVVYQLAVIIPHLSTMRLIYAVSPDTNSTSLKFDMVSYDHDMATLSMLLSYSLPVLFCFIVIVANTIVLVVQLKRSALNAFGMSAMQSQARLLRNIRIGRIAFFLCFAHLACYTPFLITIVLAVSIPSFKPGNPYFGNLLFVMMRIAGLFHMVSCLVNFFVYLAGSGKFQVTLKSLVYMK